MRRLVPGILFAGIAASAAIAGTGGTFVVGNHGHVLVPVSVNGAEEKLFVVDTAASQIVLDPEQFPSLEAGQPLTGAHPSGAHGAHGALQARPTRLRSINLWQSALHDQTAVLMKVGQFTPGHEPDFAGVLGIPYLRRFRLDLDYARRRISLDEIGGDLPDCDICTAASAVKVVPLIGGLPSVTVNVNGRSLVAVLDTGAAFSVVNDAAAAALGLASERPGEPGARVSLSFGAATPIQQEVRQVQLPVFTTLGLANEPAMILGIDYLGTGRMVLDLAGGQVWFKAAS